MRSTSPVTGALKPAGSRLRVRFNKLDDLALDVVRRLVARVPVEEHIANYRAARALTGKEKSNATKGNKKSALKKATGKKSAN